MPYSYYNEIDPNAAAWLTELIAAGHIPDGYVDTRSIWDVAPEDLREFTQHHFFAGIGGWAYALQLAGWPTDRPVWTGSCPCQPFSAAGKGAGFADERHLWPAWFHLISQCRPDVIFGEQVEAAIGHGWLDLVQADLEGSHYACGFIGVPAAGVGAPHIRQRLWFVADSAHVGYERSGTARYGRDGSANSGSELGDTDCPRPQGLRRPVAEHGTTGWKATERHPRETSLWDAANWLPCLDGKARPVEPGVEPLAHGVPARVGRLRGYGNAIVPQVAAEVIAAFLDCEHG